MTRWFSGTVLCRSRLYREVRQIVEHWCFSTTGCFGGDGGELSDGKRVQ